MNTAGSYSLVWDDGSEDGRSEDLIAESLEQAYGRARVLAERHGKAVNVWREYGAHWAMLGSAYPDGRVAGIGSKDLWELALAALG